MTVAYVHLLDHELSIGHVQGRSSPDGVTTLKGPRGMTIQNSGCREAFAIHRKQKIELEKTVSRSGLIMEEGRIFPLIGNSEIQQAITIHVAGGDAPRDLRIIQSEVMGEINVAAGRGRNKEVIMIVAAE